MNFPTPPSNPITQAVTQAAAQVVDAAAAVVEAVAEATEEAIGTATSNGVSVLRQGLDAPVAGEIMDRTASVVSGARAVVDQAAGSTVGTTVHLVTVAVGLAALALGSAVAAGSAAVRTAQAAGALMIALAEFEARRGQQLAGQKNAAMRQELRRVREGVTELRRQTESAQGRFGFEASRFVTRTQQVQGGINNIGNNFHAALDKLIEILASTPEGQACARREGVGDQKSGRDQRLPGDPGGPAARRLELVAAKLEWHLARHGLHSPHLPPGFCREWTARLQRPEFRPKVGLTFPVHYTRHP